MAETTNVVGWPQQARDYIDEVKSEMRRVTWPNWPQVRATTAVVIAAVFLFAGYFFVVDFVVRSIIDRVINYFVSK
jgi:preprotein translocase subunit SecE